MCVIPVLEFIKAYVGECTVIQLLTTRNFRAEDRDENSFRSLEARGNVPCFYIYGFGYASPITSDFLLVRSAVR